MESVLLYFFVGFFIFLVKRLTLKKPAMQPAAFGLTGMVSTAVISLAMGESLHAMTRLPWPGMALLGALAGLILGITEKKSLISTPGLQYFATLILGIIVAAIGFACMWLYNTIIGYYLQADDLRLLLPLTYLLIGFLIVFGFTFPERWLRLKKLTGENGEQSKKDRRKP